MITICYPVKRFLGARIIGTVKFTGVASHPGKLGYCARKRSDITLLAGFHDGDSAAASAGEIRKHRGGTRCGYLFQPSFNALKCRGVRTRKIQSYVPDNGACSYRRRQRRGQAGHGISVPVQHPVKISEKGAGSNFVSRKRNIRGQHIIFARFGIAVQINKFFNA